MGLIAYCKHQVTLSCGFKTQTFCLVQVFLLLAPRRLEKIRVMFALMGFLFWPFMVAILEHARSKTMSCQCSCFDVVSDEVSGIQVKATHVPFSVKPLLCRVHQRRTPQALQGSRGSLDIWTCLLRTSTVRRPLVASNYWFGDGARCYSLSVG